MAAREVIDYDAELRAYNERLRAATGLEPGLMVLDIGCGAGQSTRDAARAVAPGRVLGIDLSAPMLERARELTVAERLDNVTYQHGDAQSHPFTPSQYDVAISRFGAMFFSDPVVAFSNVARALRARARLVLLVWQGREHNEWATAIDAALRGLDRPAMPAKAADAFSLGDPATTRRILDRAGFCDIGFTDVREPVFYGADSAEALAFVRGFMGDTLASLAPDDSARALARLRDTLDDHDTGPDGVVFDSRAWIVSARRP